MRPNLRVPSVLRSAESRSFLYEVVESADHKLVHVSRRDQGHILLNNGVTLDLPILKPSPSVSSSSSHNIIQTASITHICQVCAPKEQQVRSEAAACGVELFLELPLGADLPQVFEAQTL